MSLKLNDKLDLGALARTYQERNRLQVRDFMSAEAAQQIFQCLSSETPWGLVYNRYTGTDKVIELDHDEVSRLTPEQLKQIYREV